MCIVAGARLAARRSGARRQQQQQQSAAHPAVWVRASGVPPGDFTIPAAPILIPEGPWKEIEGCVTAPKGFKAQGERLGCAVAPAVACAAAPVCHTWPG